MNQVAARLHFARVPQVVRINPAPVERRSARHEDVPIEDGLVLERKRVERAAEFILGDEERRGQLVAMPRLNQDAARVEVVSRDAFHETHAGGRSVRDERDETRAEDPRQVGRQPGKGARGLGGKHR